MNTHRFRDLVNPQTEGNGAVPPAAGFAAVPPSLQGGPAPGSAQDLIRWAYEAARQQLQARRRRCLQFSCN